MKQITKEFFRANVSSLVRFAVVWAIYALLMFLTGAFTRDNTRIPAIAVTALMGAMTLWTAIELLSAPIVFKKKLGKLPENIREEILSGFSTVPSIGKRWFYERHLMYFTRRRIEIVTYEELESADLRRNRLYLKLSGGRTLPLPFDASENPALLVAALRSRNGSLKASIDGKSVDFDNSDKKKKQ